MAPDYRFLIPVLQRINAHNRKVLALDAVLNADNFTIDVLDLVLDAFGLPPDNTVEQMKKYGDAANEHPDTFGRDWWHERYDRIAFNTDEEVWTFLETVRKDVQEERWKKGE